MSSEVDRKRSYRGVEGGGGVSFAVSSLFSVFFVFFDVFEVVWTRRESQAGFDLSAAAEGDRITGGV